MSAVSNVIFKTSVGDKSRISKLSDLFRSGKKFLPCDNESLPYGWYAGTKRLECEICPGAFNQLSVEELVAAIRQVEWDDPFSVQLFVQGQDEDRLKEIDLELPRP